MLYYHHEERYRPPRGRCGEMRAMIDALLHFDAIIYVKYRARAAADTAYLFTPRVYYFRYADRLSLPDS